MSNLTENTSLSWNDLLTLRDVLCSAEHELLAEKIVYNEQNWGGKDYDDDDAELVPRVAVHVLDEICSVEPVEGERRVLFPMHDYEQGFAMGVCVVPENVLMADGVMSAPEALLESIAHTIVPVPWAELLAYKVWLDGDWSERELYLFLASIFKAMTLLGFTQEAHDGAETIDLLGMMRSGELADEFEEEDASDNEFAAGSEPDADMGECDQLEFAATADEEAVSGEEGAELADYDQEYQLAQRNLREKVLGLFGQELADNINTLRAALRGE